MLPSAVRSDWVTCKLGWHVAAPRWERSEPATIASHDSSSSVSIKKSLLSPTLERDQICSAVASGGAQEGASQKKNANIGE